jgi:hypothetical protein
VNDKPLIDLSYQERDFFGILLPFPTGILWTTQAGGTCCAHPQFEGIFVPLDGGPHDGTDAKDPLYDRVEPYDAGRVWRFLNAHELTPSFAPIKSLEVLVLVPGYGNNGGRPYQLLEAWVPVLIDACNNTYPQLSSFRGGWGVLVYPNSD